MANPWLTHLKRTMLTHPGEKMTCIITLAKKTYIEKDKKKRKKIRRHKNKSSRRHRHD